VSLAAKIQALKPLQEFTEEEGFASRGNDGLLLVVMF
jgi:hypothetical protein